MNKDKVKFIILRTLGNFLLLFSLWGMGMTFGPVFYIEVLYRYNQLRNISYVVNYPIPPPDVEQAPSTAQIVEPTPSNNEKVQDIEIMKPERNSDKSPNLIVCVFKVPHSKRFSVNNGITIQRIKEVIVSAHPTNKGSKLLPLD